MRDTQLVQAAHAEVERSPTELDLLRKRLKETEALLEGAHAIARETMIILKQMK